MVKKIKAVYRASDGAKFETEAEAEAHEAVVNALEEYTEAKVRFTRAILKTQKTADGHPFDLSRTSVFYIIKSWPYFPHIERVSIYPYNVTVDERDVGTVIDGRWEDYKWKTTEYRIADLYQNEQVALRALLEMQEKEMAIHRKTVEETKAKIR